MPPILMPGTHCRHPNNWKGESTITRGVWLGTCSNRQKDVDKQQVARDSYLREDVPLTPEPCILGSWLDEYEGKWECDLCGHIYYVYSDEE